MFYSIAVCLYLKKNKKKFDYHLDFGGIYYLFIRGMAPGDPKRGVFFFKPTWEEIKTFAFEITGERL